MIEVRAHDDIFILELRIAARKQPDDVFGFHLRTRHAHTRTNFYRQREMRKRLVRVNRRENVLKAVAAAREEHFSAVGIEQDAHLQRRGSVPARIAQFHSWLETRRGDARPRHFGALGIRNGYHADDSGFYERASALFPGLIMRFDWAGHVRRATGDENGDLAFYVETRQVVVVQFGDGQPVTHEDGGGFDTFRGVRIHSQDSVVAELQRLRFSVAQQLERAMRFVDMHHVEINGLTV